MAIPLRSALEGLKVVDTSGNVAVFFDVSRRALLNYSATVNVGGFNSQLQVHGTGASSGSAALLRHSASSGGPSLLLAKSRNAAQAAHTIVNTGDAMGDIIAYGSDGADFIEAARVRFLSTGTPATGIVPGRIQFQAANAAGAPTTVIDFTATTFGLFGATPAAKPTVTGDRSFGTALASLLAGLAGLGIVTDSTAAGPKLTVGTTAPVSPAEGDLWVDTN